MKILVTGASSYVGARIYFDLKDKYEVIGTYFKNQLSKKFLQLDLTDKNAVEKILRKVKTEVIVHVANYPTPRDIANNEENFTALNKEATKTLIKVTNEISAKLVFISGQAALLSNNLYEIYKAESEKTVQGTKAGYLILRPSLVVGFSPNTVNERFQNKMLRCFKNKKDEGFDVSWNLQPTYIGHLSQIIDQSIEKKYWNKTMSVYFDEVTTKHKMANEILGQFGIKVSKIDKGYNFPEANQDLSLMNRFNLLPKTYQGMIKTMIEEIENRDKFRLL